MMRYVYVDMSNLWIEGAKHSAVAHGQARDVYEVNRLRSSDLQYRLDFDRLRDVLSRTLWGTAEVEIKAFGSITEASAPMWEHARLAGYRTFELDRNVLGHEKGVDVALTGQLMRDAYTRRQSGDEQLLVAGDADYVPALWQLRDDGMGVGVAFWPNAAAQLLEAASGYASLLPHLREIQLAR